MFPLFLVIPLAFILGNSFKEKLKKLLIGLSLFLLFSLPFLASSAYRQMVLFSPKSQKMLFMNWPVSGAEGLYPFILVFAVICLFSYFKAKRENILSIYLSILLLIFSVTHYHPQWFLWVTPLLLLQLVKDGFRYWEIVLVFFLSWLFIILMFEASLTYGLFSPIWPKLSEGASLATFLGKYTDVFMLKSIVRSIFAGASIFYSYHILKESR